MVRLLCLLAVTVMVLSGCVAEDPDVDEDTSTAPGFRYTDDRITIQSINDTAEAWVPTLAETPQLVVGEYWRVKVTGDLDGKSFEAYVVVAGQEKDFWLVGMPTHDFENELMVLHIPGFGQIKKDTLGFEAHDFWFDAVKFPVVEDDTWKTGFMSGGTLDAAVKKVEGLRATIEMFGNFHITLVYDAEIRGIKSMVIDNYGSFEVLEHGFDWHERMPELDGVVTVPHMADLILCHGRTAVAGKVEACTIAGADQPSDDVDIPTSFDRVSFSLILVSDVLNLAGAAGLPTALPATYYSVSATAPDGTGYQERLLPTDGPVKIVSHKHDAPGGVWSVDSIAAGPGLAFIEGIGYHVYDVEIATGRILPSVGEHQHGEGEGH